jgi:hypothetical protein
MRRPLVLAALICALTVTVWLGSNRPAGANTPDPCSPLGGPCPCEVLNSWPCDTVGTTHGCTTEDGWAATCTCRQVAGKKTWSCPL